MKINMDGDEVIACVVIICMAAVVIVGKVYG